MRMNQAKPIRLSLVQACRIIWLAEDLAGDRKLSADEDAILMPLAEQVQLIHAQIQSELLDRDDRTKPAKSVPIRSQPVDKSP